MTLNWNNVIWLASRQMRDNWISYLYSALYFGFMGLVLSTDDSWAVEFALAVLMFILIQPSLSPRYMTFNDDNEVTRHQMFLHTLPIGFDTIVSARLVAILVAGLINVPLLFIPFWYIGPEWNSLGTYLAWLAFWTGIAFAGAGLALIQEFWLSFKRWIKVNIIAVVGVILVLTLVMVLFDIRPYSWSVQAAHDHPLLLVIAGLAIGIAGLWLGTVVAVRGFRQREFAT